MAPRKTTAASTSKKRRFQVPITQYFSPSTSQSSESEQSSHYNYNAPTHSPHPTLPPTIQSSLLEVGMRVRKAVPEGYRTKITTKTSYYQYKSTTQSEQECSSAPTARAELIPFSGAFKVGNYGVQSFPQPAVALTAEMDPSTIRRYLDEESLPSSSQESTLSTDSFAVLRPNPHKRGFEIEEDEDNFISQEYIGSPQVLPYAVLHSRRTLYPRSGKLKSTRMHTSYATSPCSQFRSHLEQENWDPSISQNEDFEDASFLSRREDVDEAYFHSMREVRMSDV